MTKLMGAQRGQITAEAFTLGTVNASKSRQNNAGRELRSDRRDLARTIRFLEPVKMPTYMPSGVRMKNATASANG